MAVVPTKQKLVILNGCLGCMQEYRYQVHTARGDKEQTNNKPFNCNTSKR